MTLLETALLPADTCLNQSAIEIHGWLPVLVAKEESYTLLEITGEGQHRVCKIILA